MAKQTITEELEIPQGVSVESKDNSLVIKGSKGQVEKTFDSPRVDIKVSSDKITLTAKSASKREKAIVYAYKAHLLNAITGTQEPFVYKLKICSGHFPMNVSVSGNKLVIKNFLGEKIPREVNIREGATVKVSGSEITVESPDKETAGQVAADIEQETRRPGFDRRIFQDGIYITDKAGKAI